MFLKYTICAGFVLALSACSSFKPATDNHFVSANGSLDIRGEVVDSTDVKIFVNDNKVIDDRVSMLNGNGDFAGHFQGKPVRASCSTAGGYATNGTICTVAVAGERVKLKL